MEKSLRPAQLACRCLSAVCEQTSGSCGSQSDLGNVTAAVWPDGELHAYASCDWISPEKLTNLTNRKPSCLHKDTWGRLQNLQFILSTTWRGFLIVSTTWLNNYWIKSLFCYPLTSLTIGLLRDFRQEFQLTVALGSFKKNFVVESLNYIS